MQGTTQTYKTECKTLAEAEKLKTNNILLGFDSHIEIINNSEVNNMIKPQNKYNEKKYSVLSIRVEKDTLKEFKEKCKKNNDSQMGLINDFIKKYLEE